MTDTTQFGANIMCLLSEQCEGENLMSAMQSETPFLGATNV